VLLYESDWVQARMRGPEEVVMVLVWESVRWTVSSDVRLIFAPEKVMTCGLKWNNGSGE